MPHDESTDFRALAERMWQGQVDLVNEHHPVRSNYPGAQEFAPGMLYLKGTAAVSVVDTGAGLVMLDAGTPREIDRVHQAVRGWRPDTPLVAAVYSHHHIDHIWATRRFDEEAVQRGWSKPTVYAQTLLPAHFDRYRKTQGWNAAINTRQFLTRQPSSGWPVDYRYPDITFDRSLVLRIGELTFDMRHARGETDDHLWVWVPERRWLFPGDLFIWAIPNAGNPQKVQRYCEEWGTALREMAALDPEIMFCGHGMPIVGTDRIRQALTDTAEYLESIEQQTLALMNAALPLDEILQRVTPPPHLRDRPYLQAIYDHPQFLVRNVWRRYGGWWEGEPDMLLPAPRSQQAREWIDLAGGVERVLDRIGQLETAGDLRLACHLIEMALLSDPASAAVHAVRTRVYQARSNAEVATMSRGIFNHVAQSSREGRRDRLSQQ